MVFCPQCNTENPVAMKFCGACAASLTGEDSATGKLNPDTVLEGRYIIVKTIGRGGMGAVYQALDTRLNNTPVAIKEMSTQAVGGDLQAAVAAFKKEASMLIALRHPALPRINDFFARGEDRWYLVMDYIEGQTLKQTVDERGRIPEPEVLDWGQQLCGILDYLHKQKPPVIFRDLKPANIMLTPEGQIKLIDFGIARHFRQGSSTDTSAYGTDGFAPPEQYGENQTDARSDIYALGATLHYLLTGKDPARNPFNFELPSLTMKVTNYLENAVMRALDLNIDRRPETARDMLDLLTFEGQKPPLSVKSPTVTTVNISEDESNSTQPTASNITVPVRVPNENSLSTIKHLENKNAQADKNSLSETKPIAADTIIDSAVIITRKNTLTKILTGLVITIVLICGVWYVDRISGKNSNDILTNSTANDDHQPANDQSSDNKTAGTANQPAVDKTKEQADKTLEGQDNNIPTEASQNKPQKVVQTTNSPSQKQNRVQTVTSIQPPSTVNKMWLQCTIGDPGGLTIREGSNVATKYGTNFYMDVEAEVVDGEMMVPIRYAADGLDATCSWDAASQEIKIEKDDREIIMHMGSVIMTVNGKDIITNVAPYIKDERTRIPVRAVAEGLGYDYSTTMVIK